MPGVSPAETIEWQRIRVALAAAGISSLSWAKQCGRRSVSDLKSKGLSPPKYMIDKLCEITGCTKEFLSNPEPVDLSK